MKIKVEKPEREKLEELKVNMKVAGLTGTMTKPKNVTS